MGVRAMEGRFEEQRLTRELRETRRRDEAKSTGEEIQNAVID